MKDKPVTELAAAFHHLPAFMPYYPVGCPSLPVSIDVIEALAHGGADLIEVGVPFSDPLADGPVIQHATQIALQQGATVAGCLDAVAELRRRGVGVPLVLMGYYNPLLAFGLARLAQTAAAAGASGFIVPDLPPEEAGDLEAVLGPAGLPLVRMLAPTTEPAHAARIVRDCSSLLPGIRSRPIRSRRLRCPGWKN